MPQSAALFLLAGFCVLAILPARADAVTDLRGKARVLLVSAPASDDPQLKSQLRIVANGAAAMKERDLVLVPAVGPGAASMALRRRLDIPEGAFRALVIGKDGHTALVSDTPITVAVLSRLIDAMPMRQDEMRQRK